MAISGDIDTMPLTDLFQWVEMNRKTGCLEVKWQHEWNIMEKRIYFQNGVIVFASSNKQKERIGEFLISIKLISKEDFEKCLKEGKEKKQTDDGCYAGQQTHFKGKAHKCADRAG